MKINGVQQPDADSDSNNVVTDTGLPITITPPAFPIPFEIEGDPELVTSVQIHFNLRDRLGILFGWGTVYARIKTTFEGPIRRVRSSETDTWVLSAPRLWWRKRFARGMAEQTKH